MTTDDDPRCPECGGPIGQTATYCMHCSADLTGEREAADADDDGVWDSTEAPTGDAPSGAATAGASGADGTGDSKATAAAAETPSDGAAGDDQLLDPAGIVDDSLTVVVGIAGGIIIGLVGTLLLLILTESAWAVPLGIVAWLAATAYLVRRRTVQGAISRGAYGVSLVLLLFPLIALSPAMDGGPETRGGALLGLLLFVSVPAGIAAAVGWIASRFAPSESG